jgi:phenylpropionate dioxygenase-like ring-hydroxylating dioxygenase large terminal subunit
MPESGAEPVRAPAGAVSRDLRKTALHPDYWHPVARSKALKPGKAIGVRFAGEPIVLVRPEQGDVFALEDRCAHRQVPLHAGVVCPQGLQCCYHGWTYDATGRCVSVPYLGKDKTRPNGVRSYPCREAYGLIFVFPGEAALAASTPFPEVPSFDDPHYKTRFLDRQVECHYSFMHENLMDMNHQFLHRRLMGSIRTRFLALRREHGRVEADYTFSRAGGGQHFGEKFILGRRPKPTEERSQDLMTIATEYPYQTLRFWTAGSKEPALDLWNAYTPRDAAHRVNHTYGLMMIRRPSIPGLIHLLWPMITWFTEGIFAEDRAIVEHEQRAFDRQGRDLYQVIFPVVNALRALLLDRGLPIPEHVVRSALAGRQD